MISDLSLLQRGLLRIVSNKRARVLRRKGVYLRWSAQLQSYVWTPWFWHSKQSRRHLARLTKRIQQEKQA